MFRALDRWLLPYLLRRAPQPDGPVHVMLAVCDHFEPLHHSDKPGALSRIGQWEKRFPELIAPFRDPGGHPPKHTFFYPIEQYDPDLLAPLAELCRQTGSEVEVHLHHDNDTPDGLATSLEKGKADLSSHGLLPRDPDGSVRFAFIHGDWALNHSHPEGKGCGIDREIPILRKAGCYADFTMPSAPSPTQARVVNSIGYLSDLPGRRALDEIELAEAQKTQAYRSEEDKLLMIQGPLGLNWKRRKWSVVPRIENGDITGANPPTVQRLRLAKELGISILGVSNWLFVKWHTHGGIERNFDMLLGEPMRRFHQSLASLPFHLHYVTAREMANIVHAAEDGREGDPDDFRDYCITLPDRKE